MSIKRWILGTRIVAAWIAGGAPMVSQEMAEHRSCSCLLCPYNEKSTGMNLTGKLVMWVANLRSKKRVRNRLDAGLLVCSVCTCPLPHKVRMPIEEIAKGIDIEGGELLKYWHNCFIRRELIK